MAIAKPPITPPFASDPTTQADSDLFAAPSFMVPGYTAPGGNPEIPALGNFNWLFWWAMQSGRYHQSRGIPAWDASETEYTAGSVVYFSGNYYALFGTPTTGVDPVADPFNWMPFGTIRRPEYGDGSDGDVTISGTTSIFDRDRQYNNLTIEATGVLHIDLPFKIRVRGLLWIKSGGKLRAGHLTELAGAAATGAGTGGAGGRGSNFYGGGSIGGGSNGGQGGINTAGLDTDTLPFRQGKPGQSLGGLRLGGAGGVGGTGGSAAGAGGASTSFDDTEIDIVLALLAGGVGVKRDPTQSPKGSIPWIIMGGAGGGGGGGPSSLASPDNAHEGAGGGAGGSAGIATAQRVVTEANGAFYAPGGPGGNATTYGAGGGGGGGYWGVVCDSYAGPTQTAAVCCPGGAAGTGGSGQSVVPGAGANGRIDIKTI